MPRVVWHDNATKENRQNPTKVDKLQGKKTLNFFSNVEAYVIRINTGIFHENKDEIFLLKYLSYHVR